MEIVGLVTARGGSKRLARKNVLPLAGKPMIAWTIDAAHQSAELQRMLVSTDDEEIARVSREHGADVPFVRPTKLALDRSDHLSVVEHALGWLAEHDGVEPDYVMLLQPTSPLRTSGDIDACITLARETGAPAVVSVSALSPHAYRLGDDAVLEGALDGGGKLVAPNGAIYLNRVGSLRTDRAFVPSGTVAYVMPPERSVDVDTELDFVFAEAVMRRLSP